MKTCSITGHRPKNFPWNYYDKECDAHQDYIEALASNLYYLINYQHYTHFISGGALGVDLDFAEMIIQIRDTYSENISLELALPCKNHYIKWNKDEQLRFFKIMSNADKVSYISDSYNKDCILSRNKYVVEHCDILIACWNGNQKGGTYHTLQYAKTTNKNVILIKL